MKKEYVVTDISASPDGSPYVFVTLTESHDMDDQGTSRTRGVMSGPDPDAILRDVNRLLFQRFGGTGTTVRMDMAEYEEIGIKVGDRVVLELKKVELQSS
jgi:hypothetical protein